MDSDVITINQMLDLIIESAHPMPNYVFQFYCQSGKTRREKPVYNLIAEGFLTLFSFCRLMRDNAWSQAFALLRVALEQVSAVYILSYNDRAIAEYLRVHDLKAEYYSYENRVDEKEFSKKHNIKNRLNLYFDYGWLEHLTEDGSYGLKQMVRMAHLDELLVDYEQTLNAFAHGSISVFEMSGDNWGVMKKYGKRACLICCKLFDYLCCSYRKIIGEKAFSGIPLDALFCQFKSFYLDYYKSER